MEDQRHLKIYNKHIEKCLERCIESTSKYTHTIQSFFTAMGLCNIKLFKRLRPSDGLETAILAANVKGIEDWASTHLTSSGTARRDVTVGRHGDPPVLLAVTQACEREQNKEKTLDTVRMLLKVWKLELQFIRENVFFLIIFLNSFLFWGSIPRQGLIDLS